MTDVDVFVQENLDNWYTPTYKEAFNSLLQISGEASALMSLENVNFWLTMGQMQRFLDEIYQPEYELFSTIPGFTTFLEDIRFYKEKLRSSSDTDMELTRYVIGGALADMIRPSVEQYAFGDERRLQVLYGCFALSNLQASTTGFNALPQWLAMPDNDQYDILLRICPKQPDCGYVNIDPVSRIILDSFLAEINKMELASNT